MSGTEGSGPTINIGEIQGGNQAIGAEQHVDQRQHTEVHGDVDQISNTQINADVSGLSPEQLEALKGMGATEEEIGMLTGLAKDLKGAGQEMAPALDAIRPVVARLGKPLVDVAKGVLPGWAGGILDALVS